MSTTLAVVVRGTDDKMYPARAHTERELDRIVALTHQARCEMRPSVRATVTRLADLGIGRSVGAVMRDLKLYRCDRCDGRPA